MDMNYYKEEIDKFITERMEEYCHKWVFKDLKKNYYVKDLQVDFPIKDCVIENNHTYNELENKHVCKCDINIIMCAGCQCGGV